MTRWSELIQDEVREPCRPSGGRPAYLVGVLPGEGVGPVVTEAALTVLSALEASSPCSFEIRTGSSIGLEAEASFGEALTEEVADFCDGVFRDGGAILAGAGGGRFVYDLRRRFDLFCKLSPLVSYEELGDAARVRADKVRGADILVVRENVSGIYHGRERVADGADGRTVHHEFRYTAGEVERILRVGARLAGARRGKLSVVVKDGGLPALSRLWRDCAAGVAEAEGVAWEALDVDYAAYRIVEGACEMDVVVAPNLFGDVLSDVGSLLMGSRALSYGASFASAPRAVYQTNHGAAFDLVGTDRANPAAQILSLAMMLRESFGLEREASVIEEGLRDTWRQGWRTPDLATPGTRHVGTREMARRVAEAVSRLQVSVA
jgi:3-isopropylmalate dehydrogenase